MKLNFILFFTLIFFSLSVFGTKIHGNTFKPFVGKTVNLIEYTDYVTLNYRVLQSTEIDSSGNFYFDYDINETQQAIIQIEYLIGIIYLEPNQKYSIKFPPKSEDGTYKLTRNNVNIIFDSIPLNDINGLILEFDRMYDQFLQDNRYNVGKKIFHVKLDTFKIAVQNQFKGVRNSYFKNYVRYSIADLELVSPSSHLKVNKLGLYNTHIINKKINTKHHAQMRFLLNFYEKTLNNQIGKVGSKITTILQEKPSTLTERIGSTHIWRCRPDRNLTTKFTRQREEIHAVRWGSRGCCRILRKIRSINCRRFRAGNTSRKAPTSVRTILSPCAKNH
mgnify:CR=1 FL=1